MKISLLTTILIFTGIFSIGIPVNDIYQSRRDSEETEASEVIPTQTSTPTKSPTATLTPTLVVKKILKEDMIMGVTHEVDSPAPTEVGSNTSFNSEYLEEEINKINLTIAKYQSAIQNLLEQEKIQCEITRAPQYFQPEAAPALPGEIVTIPPTRMLDPMIDIYSDYQCSMSYFDSINDLKEQINSLEKERRLLEMKKVGK